MLINSYRSGGLLRKYQDGGVLLENIFKKYPAMRNLGDVTLKADPKYKRRRTGVGDIEYFSPEQENITYPNGYSYDHPKPGTHGIVYNPRKNNQQSIELDMLHGMSGSDSVYSELRDNFGKDYLNSKFKDDFYRDIDNFKNEVGKEKFNEWYKDDNDYFKKNYLDGVLRNLLFEGSEKDFKKQRYWTDAKKEYLSDDNMNKSYNQLIDYLKTNKINK